MLLPGVLSTSTGIAAITSAVLMTASQLSTRAESPASDRLAASIVPIVHWPVAELYPPDRCARGDKGQTGGQHILDDDAHRRAGTRVGNRDHELNRVSDIRASIVDGLDQATDQSAVDRS